MNAVGERAGNNISFWERTAEKFRSAPLTEDLEIDVCVVGAGIAGMTTAYLLAREGRSVAVIDDGPVGGGMTGRTTAHLSNALDDRYYEIERMLDKESSQLCAESHTAAIDRIEQIVRDERIDCDFERVDGYLFLPPQASTESIDKEFEAVHRAGLTSVTRIDMIPVIDATRGPGLKFPQQAQFHPLKYLLALAEAITRMGVKIFTGTRVVEVTGKSRQLKTRDGHTVTAKSIVVTTNTPINDRYAIHTKQAPYATYAVALRVDRGAIAHALFWDTGETAKDDKQTLGPASYHYVRLAPDGEHDVLIVGGEDHKTAQAFDFEERFANLERWARERFPLAQETTDRWSGQVMEPVDGVAYIGRNPGDDGNVYIATGDSGNGITHGTIAGILISDLIAGRENRWAELYDPTRKTFAPLVAADYLKENVNVAAQMRGYITTGDVGSVDEIKPGEGALVRDKVKKIAAYRDENGALHEMSAICPHLKCIVRWNGAEKTWDCPCHGSRFDCLGHMVNGPSIADLEPLRNGSLAE